MFNLRTLIRQREGEMPIPNVIDIDIASLASKKGSLGIVQFNCGRCLT